MFSPNKLLKLKYIHHFFFLKFLTKKSWCVLWAGASYRPGNTIITDRIIVILIKHCDIREFFYYESDIVPIQRTGLSRVFEY
jgi:hypothetical protein